MEFSAFMRGLSEEAGSWKTIWICPLAQLREEALGRALPCSSILPEVGLSKPQARRPRVDFPQPDSPTRPRL